MSYSDHVMVYMFSGGRQEAVYTFLNATLAPGQSFAWVSRNTTLLKVSFQDGCNYLSRFDLGKDEG